MATLSEDDKDFTIDNVRIALIDLNSIKQVPESHTWIETTHGSTISPSNKEELGLSIPVIDLEDPDVVDLIFKACESWGAFILINHGIPMQLLEEVVSQTKQLFGLPFEQKIKAERAPDGATGYGAPRISRFHSKLMWIEGFTIKGNSMVDHAKELWPDDYQGFCDVMDEYKTSMKGLGDKLMGLLLKSLNMPESLIMNWIKQDPTYDPKNPANALQLNSYPPCPDPAQTVGLVPHTDSMFFTILHQSFNINGLQVFKEGPGWVSVDLDPGALVVNVGDLLHIISNARFRSAFHRAYVDSEKQRISLAYFYSPTSDFKISPFVDYPGCEGPCYRSLEVKEYLKVKAKHQDLALSIIKN